VLELSREAINGGFGSGVGIVSYGALRCESVTGDVYEPLSASCEGHMITIALSPMKRPNPLRNRSEAIQY